MEPKEIIKEAWEQLGAGGYIPDCVPTWHPYYWLGRLRAAEEVMKRDRVRRRDDQRRVRRPTR